MKIPIDDRGLLVGYLEDGNVTIDCVDHDLGLVVYSLSMTEDTFYEFTQKVKYAILNREILESSEKQWTREEIERFFSGE